MSFLGSLAKSFVRSAVNQVGRDGGKVISNKVYGNSHSTPINQNGSISLEDSIDRENLQKEKEWPLIKIFWAIIISLFLPIIGSLIVLYRAILNLKAKEMTLYRFDSQPVYSSDRRFTNGRRFEGNRQVKIPVIVEINENEKKIKLLKGVSYLIISVCFLIVWISEFYNKYQS
jgi:hypothetical protein